MNKINKSLNVNKQFVVHVCMKSLNLIDIEKNYSFIHKMSEILKTLFPDKLEKCFIYNAPIVFSQLFNMLSVFIDKKTLEKIQIIE